MKWTTKQTERLIDLYNNKTTYNQIAKKLGLDHNNIRYKIYLLQQSGDLKRRRNQNKTIKTEPTQKELYEMSYKPQQLKIGQAYSFTQGNKKNKWLDQANDFTGKVIKEYKHYYLIQCRHNKETILKNSMMELEIKELH